MNDYMGSFNLNERDGVMQISSAQKVGGHRKPRTRTIALTDCVCYDASGKVTRTIARHAPSKAKPRQQKIRTIVIPHNDISLLQAMSSNHEGDV